MVIWVQYFEIMSKLIYHWHSFVEVRHKEKIIYIDPFIEGNSSCDIKVKDAKCDYIILTHGHNDHYGSTEDIARGKDVITIAMVELCDYLEKKGVKTHEMNLGGAHQFPFGRVKLTYNIIYLILSKKIGSRLFLIWYSSSTR